ncbi:MAG: hypothetical protein ACK42A_09440 [Pyrinomonadaceae bacterium]
MNIIKLNGTEPVKTAEKPPETNEKPADQKEDDLSELHMRIAISDLTEKLYDAGAISPKLLIAAGGKLFEQTMEGARPTPDDIVARLKEKYPEQFPGNQKTKSIDAGAGRDTEGFLTAEALSAMTADEIRRLDWESVKRALQR